MSCVFLSYYLPNIWDINEGLLGSFFLWALGVDFLIALLRFFIKSLPTFVFLSVRPRQLRILSGVSKSLANYSWFMKYLSNSKRYVEAFSYWNRSILSLLWMKRSKKERYLFTSAAICILLGCFSELFWGLSIILLLNAANLSRI